MVREAPGKGMGAFAAAPIEKGSWVCEYVGKLVSWDEYAELYDAGMDRVDYMFKVVDPETDADEPEYVFIDGYASGHFSRYINHGRVGNLEIRVSPTERRIDFHASTRIAVGDELAFDCARARM